jgi:hypothetical protein
MTFWQAASSYMGSLQVGFGRFSVTYREVNRSRPRNPNR